MVRELSCYNVPFYSNTELMLCCALSRLKLLQACAAAVPYHHTTHDKNTDKSLTHRHVAYYIVMPCLLPSHVPFAGDDFITNTSE